LYRAINFKLRQAEEEARFYKKRRRGSATRARCLYTRSPLSLRLEGHPKDFRTPE
jgi:hypothetical protein